MRISPGRGGEATSTFTGPAPVNQWMSVIAAANRTRHYAEQAGNPAKPASHLLLCSIVRVIVRLNIIIVGICIPYQLLRLPSVRGNSCHFTSVQQSQSVWVYDDGHKLWAVSLELGARMDKQRRHGRGDQEAIYVIVLIVYIRLI